MKKAIFGGSIGMAVWGALTLIALAASSYTLFGGAAYTTGNGSATGVKLVSDLSNTDTKDDFSGIDFAIPADLKFSQVQTLGLDYNITDDDCKGGSPRFQVNIGGKSVFVYIGPAPNFTGCTPGWHTTGDLTDSPDARFDTSQYPGGNFYMTYAQAEALLGTQAVTGIQLVIDGGWAFTDQEQTAAVDNVVVNDKTYTFEPNTPQNADQCKNNGWQSLEDQNRQPFKNQGQCVSSVVSQKNAH